MQLVLANVLHSTNLFFTHCRHHRQHEILSFLKSTFNLQKVERVDRILCMKNEKNVLRVLYVQKFYLAQQGVIGGKPEVIFGVSIFSKKRHLAKKNEQIAPLKTGVTKELAKGSPASRLQLERTTANFKSLV